VQAPPNAYLPPAPPPKKAPPGIVIGLIAVGCLGALGLAALFVGGVVIGFQRELKRDEEAKAGAVTAPLSASYTTTNGLLTAHYPPDFAAKNLDSSTLAISRNLGHDGDEVLTLAAVAKPITDDPHELARLLWSSHDKNVADKGGTFEDTGERATVCLGKFPGVERSGTFVVPPAGPYVSKGCFFVHDNRGYELRYDVARARSTEDIPLLERIIEATQLAP
jgi:hypothetical protein